MLVREGVGMRRLVVPAQQVDQTEGQEGTLAEPNVDGVAVSGAREAGQEHRVRPRLNLYPWHAPGDDLREGPPNADKPPTHRFLRGRVQPPGLAYSCAAPPPFRA